MSQHTHKTFGNHDYQCWCPCQAELEQLRESSSKLVEATALRAEVDAEHDLNERTLDRMAKLQAENDRLVVELTHRVGWEERCLDAEATANALRRQNEQARELYAAMLAELNALRAENKQLKAQHANDLHTIDVGSKANAALMMNAAKHGGSREGATISYD